MPSNQAPSSSPLPDAATILERNPRTFEAKAIELGRSREGRPVLGRVLGRGPIQVSLIGGCHADEPVGPALLRRLAVALDRLPAGHPTLERFSWWIAPHVNPDGEARNRAWWRGAAPGPKAPYELDEYLRLAVRERPGDDLEFGFPEPAGDDSRPLPPRPEAQAIADFLRPGAPFAVHGSFHGMSFATGPWFLLEPSWSERMADSRTRLASSVEALGYRLYDVDRKGEKGFHRIAPGFSTRPDSGAMGRYFLEAGDPDEAAKFRPSSMEFVCGLGGDPLTFVTEMPLFLWSPDRPGRRPGPIEPSEAAAVRSRLALAARAGRQGLAAVARDLAIRPMPVHDQMTLQLALLEEAVALAARIETGSRTG